MPPHAQPPSNRVGSKGKRAENRRNIVFGVIKEAYSYEPSPISLSSTSLVSSPLGFASSGVSGVVRVVRSAWETARETAGVFAEVCTPQEGFVHGWSTSSI